MIPRTDQTSFSVSEFAHHMKVSYSVVRYWCYQGLIPGAFQQGDGKITIKRWRIPREALGMERPKRGGSKIVRTKEESKHLGEAQKRIAELVANNEKLLLELASLRGKYDQLEEDLGVIAAQNNDFQGLYEDVLYQMEIKIAEIKRLEGELLEANNQKEELVKEIHQAAMDLLPK